jgi:hypothetical protein
MVSSLTAFGVAGLFPGLVGHLLLVWDPISDHDLDVICLSFVFR